MGEQGRSKVKPRKKETFWRKYSRVYRRVDVILQEDGAYIRKTKTGRPCIKPIKASGLSMDQCYIQLVRYRRDAKSGTRGKYLFRTSAVNISTNTPLMPYGVPALAIIINSLFTFTLASYLTSTSISTSLPAYLS